MAKTYNKLVRDKIPEMIKQAGKQCEIATLRDREYQEALREKLIEEATEVASASPEEFVQELADLYEVIDALLIATGIDEETILAQQKQKHEERGGFQKRIKLLSVAVNQD